MSDGQGHGHGHGHGGSELCYAVKYFDASCLRYMYIPHFSELSNSFLRDDVMSSALHSPAHQSACSKLFHPIHCHNLPLHELFLDNAEGHHTNNDTVLLRSKIPSSISMIVHISDEKHATAFATRETIPSLHIPIRQFHSSVESL